MSDISKSELAKLRKALFPTVAKPTYPEATDPMAVAWAFKGISMKNKLNPDSREQWWWNRSANAKLLIITVAKLQVEGIVATPRRVHEELGMFALTTVRRNLNYLTAEFLQERSWAGRNGWVFSRSPIARVKHGRTFRYYLVEPEKS